MFYFCRTEGVKRQTSLALGERFLRGKEKENAEDEFAGTIARMRFFVYVGHSKNNASYFFMEITADTKSTITLDKIR